MKGIDGSVSPEELKTGLKKSSYKIKNIPPYVYSETRALGYIIEEE